MKGNNSSKKKLHLKQKRKHRNEQEVDSEQAEEKEEEMKEYDRKEDSIDDEVDSIQKYDSSNITENDIINGNDGDQLLKRCKTESCQKDSKVKHITDAKDQMQTENQNDEVNKKTNSTNYEKTEYGQIEQDYTQFEKMDTQPKKLKEDDYKQETDELSEALAKKGKEIDEIMPSRGNENAEKSGSNISTNDQEDKGANDEHTLKKDLEIIKENIDHTRDDNTDN